MQEKESNNDFIIYRNRVGFGKCRGKILPALDESYFI